jgi:long-chain acyl-CoA synthetase
VRVLSEHETLRDVVAGQARRLEKRTFLEFGTELYSYADVDDRSDRVATGLSRIGLRTGEHLGVLLLNRPELLFFFLGASKLGAVCVLLDPAWEFPDVAAALAASDVSAVVAEASFRPLQSIVPGVRHWIFLDRAGLPEDALPAISRGSSLGFWPDLSPDDPAVIAFTRGTHRRKAVVLSHRNLLSNSRQILQPFRIDETDRFFCALPLHRVAAQVLLVLTPWLAGASCTLSEPYSEGSLSVMEAAGSTVLAATPGIYTRISASGDTSDLGLSSLRLAVCHSGPAGEQILRQFEDRYDALIVETYGLLEATCLTCANPYTGVRKPGSLGLPLPGQQCRVVGPDGCEVEAGRTGEIVLQGPNVMLGYHRSPEETAHALRGGWMHTGDQGYVDGDGYYYLSG